MDETCDNCKFSSVMLIELDDVDQPHLVCRRYPPTLVAINEAGTSLLPLVHAGEWCGEWKDGEAMFDGQCTVSWRKSPTETRRCYYASGHSDPCYFGPEEPSV